jgi:archaellum component FlaC
MPTELEPPTLSEVIRRLDDLKTDVKDYAGKTVSTEIYLADKGVHDREMKELKLEVKDLENDLDTAKKELAKEIAANAKALKEQIDKNRQIEEDAKSRTRLLWLGIIATAVVGAVVTFIVNGGLAH